MQFGDWLDTLFFWTGVTAWCCFILALILVLVKIAFEED